MHTVYVIFQLDTEDFITPESDDVILHLVQIFNKHGIKGSFAIVGEKARILVKRGRRDIIEALKSQDIAYQSNYHSVHPTIAEFLKDKDWEEGVNELFERGAPGIRDLEVIFGIRPSAFIQPGGCWVPQTPYVMGKLGINVYADGIFLDQPVWFCNVIAIRYTMSYNERESGTKKHLNWLKSEFKRHYNRLEKKGGLLVIVLHPCMLLIREFWDAINFAYGKNPKEVAPAPLVFEEEYRKRLEEFEEFVKYVISHPKVKVITFRNLPDLLKPSPMSIKPSLALSLAREISSQSTLFSYYTIGDVDLSAAETFSIFINFLAFYFKEGKMPHSIPVRSLLGPTSMPPSLSLEFKVSTHEILELCVELDNELNLRGRIPHVIKVGEREVGPGTFMKALAMIIVYINERGKIPDAVTITPWREIPEVSKVNLVERVRRQWKGDNGIE